MASERYSPLRQIALIKRNSLFVNSQLVQIIHDMIKKHLIYAILYNTIHRYKTGTV